MIEENVYNFHSLWTILTRTLTHVFLKEYPFHFLIMFSYDLFRLTHIQSLYSHTFFVSYELLYNFSFHSWLIPFHPRQHDLILSVLASWKATVSRLLALKPLFMCNLSLASMKTCRVLTHANILSAQGPSCFLLLEAQSKGSPSPRTPTPTHSSVLLYKICL